VIAAAVSSTWIVSQADARAAALSAAASFGAVAVVCAWNLLRRADAGRRSAPPPRLSSVPVGTSEDALS